MLRYGLVASCLLFSSCTTTSIIDRQKEVVIPSDILYQCPVSALPDPNTLTDLQVSKLIVSLYKNNQRCRSSLSAIHGFLAKADAVAASSPANVRSIYNQYKKN